MTVMEMARCMLKSRNVPLDFWAEAVATVIYLLNKSFVKSVLEKTPFKTWFNFKPTVSHLRVFGSVCYALTTTSRHTKAGKK